MLELSYYIWVFVVTRFSYWCQDICPCDLGHLWNCLLSGPFVFHKHILFDLTLTVTENTLCRRLERPLTDPRGRCTCRRTVRRQHSGDSHSLRVLTSTSWRHVQLVSLSFRAYIRGITVLLPFCKAFLEATGVLVERSIFLITSLPKVVWLGPIWRPRLEVAAFLPGV